MDIRINELIRLHLQSLNNCCCAWGYHMTRPMTAKRPDDNLADSVSVQFHLSSRFISDSFQIHFHSGKDVCYAGDIRCEATLKMVEQ